MIKNTLSILIVEDDLSFALELEMLIKEIGYQVAGRVDNASAAQQLIQKQLPDLILMDIELKGDLSGIELAEKIASLHIPILFITSYAEDSYYERAKKTNFIGYLVKPVKEYSLRSSIELAIATLQNKETDAKKIAFSTENTLYYKKNNLYHKVLIEDINFIEANGDYTITHTTTSTFTASIRLGELENLLRDRSFLRIHRSFIINLDKAESISPEQNKIFIGGHSIPFSRRIKAELLKDIRFLR